MNNPIDKSIFNETGCIRKDQLLRYRDKQMSGLEQHEVEEHLVDCVLCSEALEGLVFINGTETLDALQHDISKMVSPSPVHSFRPWLAAATITGVVLFSYFTYLQYKNMSQERLAVNEQLIPVEENALVTSEDASSLSDSSPVNNSVEPKETMKDGDTHGNKKSLAIEAVSAGSIQNEAMMAGNADDALEIEERTAVVEMEIPAAALKDKPPVSSALRNGGNQNITYVDNVKVIDYNTYDADNVKQADVARSTASKYQNKKKEAEAAEAEQKSGEVINRKADYLELVADPVILFNNKRYESANAGFDKLLELNKNDQNAAFYKGLSLYNMNQFNPALELLVPISNDSASPFMEEAKFYTARSYISNGEVSKGKIILEKISGNNGFYSKQAKEELKKIK